MPKVRDFDVEGMDKEKKQTIQKEPLFDTFAKKTTQEICA